MFDLNSKNDDYISAIYKFFIGNLDNSKNKSDDDFIQSIDLFIEWHKQLELKLLPEKDETGRRQETKALLFTTAIGAEKLHFMRYLLLCPKAEKYLPVFIFNYIANYTDSDYKKLIIIKNKKCKGKYNSKEFIDSLLFQAKQTRYLLMPERFSQNMGQLYHEDLIKKIKYSFIHIASFLKILSLPICQNANKLECIAWYFSQFPDNANTFFAQNEKTSMNIANINNEENHEEYLDNEKYSNSLSCLNRYIEYIMNPDNIKSVVKYADKIEKYIKKNNSNYYIPESSYSFSDKYNYFYGKYLYKIMVDYDRGIDLFKLISYEAKASEVGIGEIGFEVTNKLSKILSINNAVFKFMDIKNMHLANKSASSTYHPLHAIVFNHSDSYPFERDSYDMEGLFSEIIGQIIRGSNEITCFIPELKSMDNQRLYIKNLKLEITKLSKLKSCQWALYILTYYILYMGFQEDYPIYNKFELVSKKGAQIE